MITLSSESASPARGLDVDSLIIDPQGIRDF
jgi:hypothetical protein